MKTEIKHTPKPWIVNGSWHIQAPTGIAGYRANGEPIPALPTIVAQVVKGHGISHKEVEVNAHLIAAAPELLEALKALFEHCAMTHKHWGEGCNVKESDAAIAGAHAAVAKAEGKV
jgi:hypothetical protein